MADILAPSLFLVFVMSSATADLIQRILSAGTTFLGALVFGAQLINNNSLSTQLASTRELVRKIEDFTRRVQPHERDKIERGQPSYFKNLEKTLQGLNLQLDEIELSLIESDRYTGLAREYGPAIASCNQLKNDVKVILATLGNAHADLLKTTNAIRARFLETDGDNDSQDNTGATASLGAIMVHPMDQSNILPVLSSDRPSASSLVLVEQSNIPVVPRSAPEML